MRGYMHVISVVRYTISVECKVVREDKSLDERRLSTAYQTILPRLAVAQRQAPLVGGNHFHPATVGYFSNSASGLVAAANGAPMT